ncbi:MAG: NAD(P)-dependent oxidoreductase [Burkholderiales bacterium]|nr:NAD(P)-dependent oxidoreductase [Burkholderiales bacterium]
MKRVTVVGAQGYVGRAFCHAARAQGIEVFAVSSRDGTGLDPVTGLVGDRFALPTDTDAVLYLAQSPHYRELPRHAAHLMTVNCVSAVEIARRAAEAGVRRFLYASTGSVYAPAFTPLAETAPLQETAWYPLSKILAEKALALFRPALDVCALRIFGIYGPDQQDKLVPNLIARLRAGQPVTLQANPSDPLDRGGLRISLCHVDDVCRVLFSLLKIQTNLPDVLNLGDADAIDMRTLVTLLAKRLGVIPDFLESTAPRTGDLVCDAQRLHVLVRPQFRPMAQGIEEVVDRHEGRV